MSLAIYKWITPRHRGGFNIQYAVIDRNMPDSHVMLIYPAVQQNQKGKLIFSSCGLTKDYESQRTPSSFLDILIVTGLTKDTIYREYNKIQESDTSYIHIEP